jgi:hypothetical protein
MVAKQQPEEARGEYGPPADMYRRIARAYNRLDYPLAAVLLHTNSAGEIIPWVSNLYSPGYAYEWWGGPRLSGFYGALFDNQWLDRGPVRLVREFLRGGKWLGPIMPPGLAM